MKCDTCGAKNGLIHLTQIVNSEVTTYYLCEACAAEKGLDTRGPPVDSPISDLLATLGSEAKEEGGGGLEDLSCSFCSLSYADFHQTGRLGCPHCYETFESRLRTLLRRIHGGAQHVGKVYLPPDPTASDREMRLDGLRRKLQRAIDAENFERAAELRDQIQAMEPVR